MIEIILTEFTMQQKIAYKWHTTQQYQFKANRTEVTEYLYNPLEIKTTASDGTKRRACHNR